MHLLVASECTGASRIQVRRSFASLRMTLWIYVANLRGTTLDAFAGARPDLPQVWQPVSQPANLISRGPVVQRIGLQFPKLTMQVRFLPGLPSALCDPIKVPRIEQKQQVCEIVAAVRIWLRSFLQ